MNTLAVRGMVRTSRRKMPYTLVYRSSCRARGDAIEEGDDPRLQRVLRPDHQQAVFLDQTLQQLGAVTQMIGGGADVGPDRLAHERVRISSEARGKQGFHGRSNTVHDRAQVS